MTPEREREIRAACERTGFDRIDPGDSPGEMMRDLLDEIDLLRSYFRQESLARSRTVGALAEAREEMDRLRRLPAIATCGKCGWHRVTRVFADRLDYCGHPSARNGDVGNGEPPPEWCPLRGGER